MSSNKQNILIDRTNYEELFLLYIDGELSIEQTSAVEAFAALHPDLQEELEVLLTTKLDSETLFFEGKESLLSQNIKAGFIDDSILLYIDNELPASEAEKVTQRITEDAVYAEQYRQLQAAILDGSEVLIYPYKKELYRSTERKVRPLFWMRAAVAVFLLLGISTFWIISNDDTKPDEVTVADNSVKKEGGDKVENLSIPLTATGKEEKKKASSIIKENETLTIQKEEKPFVAVQSPAKKLPFLKNQQVNKLPAPDVQNRVIASVDIPASTDLNIQKRNQIDVSSSQQIINNPSVTTKTVPAYTTIDAAAPDAGLSFAVASNSNDKKGSVRGFLRKASRFIERRTGINPVNEDDELLIGVVAIKL